jgi:hypothetical protein
MTARIAATVSYLLSNTPTEIVSRSREYDPVLVRQTRDRWVYNVGDKIVRIKLINASARLNDSDILVSCTCKFWRWNGPDFNADQQEYSERSFSNLSEPVERDPHGKYLICKHVYAALKQFKNDLKTISLD